MVCKRPASKSEKGPCKRPSSSSRGAAKAAKLPLAVSTGVQEAIARGMKADDAAIEAWLQVGVRWSQTGCVRVLLDVDSETGEAEAVLLHCLRNVHTSHQMGAVEVPTCDACDRPIGRSA